MKMFYVYAHVRRDTNSIFYIGKGCGRRAWSRQNRNRMWVGIVGKTAYDVVILRDGLTEADALAIEQALTLGAPEGTLASFTLGGPGTSGYRHTLDTRIRMSANRSGKPLSDAHRAALSAAVRSRPHEMERRREKFSGDQNPAKKLKNRLRSAARMHFHNPMRSAEARAKAGAKNKGRVFSDEHRAKLSAAHSGIPRGPRSPETVEKLRAIQARRKRPVETLCGLRFESMSEAASALGIRQGGISNACIGRRRRAGGYEWRFAS